MRGANFLAGIAIGFGATLLIDLWALALRRAFDVRSLNYCLLGRWILHMPNGKVAHDDISVAAPKAHECAVGWTMHYLIGVGFAVTFVCVAPNQWLSDPTLVPAVSFGILTVLVPFFTLQPALGLGIASSKTKRPSVARLKSLITHSVFGVGLWIWASVLVRFVASV